MQQLLSRNGRVTGPVYHSVTRLIASLLVAGTLCLPVAHAVEMPGLYTVEVALDPNDPDAQANAYRRGLMEVLVRITGSTGVAESAQFATLFPNPGQHIRQMRPGPDDTLIISFNENGIERELRRSGAPVWGPDRPLTLVWLAVDWGQGEREIIAADDQVRAPGAARSIERNKMLRERIQAVATRRGIPVAFPLLDVEDLRAIGFSDIWGGFDDPLLAASERYEARSVLVARIRPEAPRDNRWTWYFDGQRQDWGGTAEEALNLLVDSLAARDALPAGQRGEQIRLTITGINSVGAYGQVQQFIEGLRVLDSLHVSRVTSDQIEYEVEIRGGTERLSSALRPARFLVPETMQPDIDNRRFTDSRYPFGQREVVVAAARELRYAYQPVIRQRIYSDREAALSPIESTLRNPPQR